MIEAQFSDDNNLKPNRNSAGYHDHSHDVSFFQICQSCFWFTSTLHTTRMIKICPVCTSEGIDSLPISPNEVYPYDVSESANLSLSFRNASSTSSFTSTSNAISSISAKEIGELIYNELWLLLWKKMTCIWNYYTRNIFS
jgi:hypothetical protein